MITIPVLVVRMISLRPLSSVSLQDVTSLLQSIILRKSIGPDGLPNILKECANDLAPSITVLINCGLGHGLCPTYWKFANVTPIHKKTNETLFVTKYRPISLLPVISKLQERLVDTQLIIHISEQIYPFQHGFLGGKSCVSQLLQVFHEIGKASDSGLETDIVYLDFAKAFDSVCHQRLISKLKWFRIDGSLLRWFESYLTGRMQRNVLNGSSSSWNVVKSGVPQGSLLGPTLFLLYINDMPQVIKHCKLAMFANDSKCT